MYPKQLVWPTIVLVVATVVLIAMPTGFRWFQATVLFGSLTVVYLAWKLLTGTSAERWFLLPPLAAALGAFVAMIVMNGAPLAWRAVAWLESA